MILMKLTFSVENGLIAGKKSISLTVDDNYEPKGKSENDWMVTEFRADKFWSLLYYYSESEEYEFQFEMNDFGKTLTPIYGVIWRNGVVDSDFIFTVK